MSTAAMRLRKVIFAWLATLALVAIAIPSGAASEVEGIPVPDTVTLVELGADNCIPCRMQKPIIEELKNEYQGRAAVISIDVYRQYEKARKLHPLVTPTLIFFDRQGHESERHSGFMDKAGIVAKLDQLLARQEH